MNSSGSGEQQRDEEPTQTQGGKRTPKANKSCVACRLRKVKCDAPVIGFPCSSCTSRHCARDCVLAVRKDRTRNKKHNLLNAGNLHTTVSPATFERRQSDSLNQYTHSEQLTQTPISDSSDGQSTRQPEQDLVYLNILNDAVPDHSDTPTSTLSRAAPDHGVASRKPLYTRFDHLDDITNEFLAKKGVFDLPPRHHLDVLIKTYFDHVYPFAPVINRADFIHDYQAGDYSLFLLYVMLTPVCIHAPTETLFSCGFTSPSAAQESFFSKANLLHDFAPEDPLVMLQGSIILCSVILDRPSDRDFGYWFHNAIRLATKIDLRNACSREAESRPVLKLYRRIWWALYSLDIFHVFVNSRRSRLLENTSNIKPRTEDDWDLEDESGTSGLLTPITPQQRAFPVVHCELFRIFGQLLTLVAKNPASPQQPTQMMHPLDAWRKSLATKMRTGENTGTDVYYLTLKSMSYRFECILLRRLRQQSTNSNSNEWTKRLRTAILELDTIAMRVLASDNLLDYPTPFITTMTVLLALHIESALNPNETDLVRSTARIAVSQTMLVLSRGKEVPVLKRALPIFEEILTKKNLHSLPGALPSLPEQPQSQNNSMSNTQMLLHPSQMELGEGDPSLYGDLLGLDFFDDWKLDSWGSLVDIDMNSQQELYPGSAREEDGD